MELVFQLPFFRPSADEIFNFFQLIGTACLKTTGVVEDKTVSRGIYDSFLDIMLSTLAKFQSISRYRNGYENEPLLLACLNQSLMDTM